MQEHSAENTNKDTKLCMDCFRDYLCEKKLLEVENLTIDNLPNFLSEFYTKIKKKDKPKVKVSAREDTELVDKISIGRPDEDVQKFFPTPYRCWSQLLLQRYCKYNARHLQELILFNIIYFMGRHRRENLGYMKKDTFQVSIDAEGQKYIHQVATQITQRMTHQMVLKHKFISN